MSKNQGIQTVIFPTHDLALSKALFTALLGAEPALDQPYYVGWNVAGQDIGLDPNGHARGMTGGTPYWHVDDLKERLAALVAAGAEIQQDVTDVGGGKLIASVKGVDGNVVGLLQNP